MASSPFPAGSQICAYLRDSGGSDQDLSVDQQEGELRTWCKENSLMLTQIFKDVAAPGSSTVSREAFLEMIRYFRRPHRMERGIIVWKYSRFARDIDDAQYYKADLRRRGFEIYSVKDPIPEGSTGRFFEAALDWMNQKFLEDLSADVKRGLHHLVREYGAMPGTPPIGFVRKIETIGVRRDGKPHVISRWVPTDDPELRTRILDAWHSRAAGAYLSDIHKKIHLFATINGYTTFFRNPLFKGELRYGDQVFPNYCDPLIDAETWDAVQEINRMSKAIRVEKGVDSPDHPRRLSSPYLFSGLAYCARCGTLLVGGSSQNSKESKRRYYYQCGKANRQRTCDMAKIPKEIFEDAVLATLADYILDPDVITAQQKILEGDQLLDTGELAGIEKSIRSQIANNKRKMNNVTETLAEMGKSKALQDKLAELEKREGELQARLDELKQRSQAKQEDRTTNLERIQKTATTIKEHFSHFDLLTQKKILRGLISRISVDRTGRLISGLVEYYQPPEELLKEEGGENEKTHREGEENSSQKRWVYLCPHREGRYTCVFSKNFEITISRNNSQSGEKMAFMLYHVSQRCC